MSSDILKNVVCIAGLSLAMVWGVNNKEMIYDKTGLTAKMEARKEQNTQHMRAKEQASLTPVVSQGTVAIKKSERDGQFWTQAQVNNRPVKFLVDTGASSVALTIEDAKRVGVNTKQLDYNVPISTAGGKIMAAYVDLKSVKVGTINVSNVKALIVPADMSTSLLGMSYLGQIRKIEVTPKALILMN